MTTPANEKSADATGILLVDDETAILYGMAAALELRGFTDVHLLADAANLLPLLARQEFAVVVLDLNMNGIDGRDLLPKITELHPEITVIVATGAGDIATAVQCVRAGAFDFLAKPVDPDSLEVALRRACEFSALRRENRRLNHDLAHMELDVPPPFRKILTSDRNMLQLFSYAQAVAQSTHPVLITGETGVGKELFARAIHEASRRSGRFVAINTAGLDDLLFADTLFGHRRGAFTGAERDHAGLIDQADGGTLFLDEIGDLSPSSQVKLLRILQEGEYYPLGTDTPRHANARIIFATNRDPEQLQKSPTFRKDLFYRISTHQLSIPPLRARKDDLLPLTQHFIHEMCAELGRAAPPLKEGFLHVLREHNFPGNIRELKGLITDLVSRGGELSEEMLRIKLPELKSVDRIPPTAPLHAPADVAVTETVTAGLLHFGDRLPTLREAERELVEEALRRSNHCQTKAAKLLGVSQQAISKRIQIMRTITETSVQRL